MAVGALPRRHRVRTRQRKARRGVVERSVGPSHGVVAGLAGGRKTCMRHRGRRVGEIILVARNAGGHGDAVVIGAVAIGARPRGHGV